MSDEKQEILIPTDGTREVAPPPTPMEILDKMSREGVDPQALQVMSDLAERWRDRDAVDAFSRAFTAFHEALPTLVAETKGQIKKQGVVIIEWMYDKLPVLARKVRPVLKQFGLSFSFDSDYRDGGYFATAELRHVLGHSIKAHSFCPVDSGARTSVMHAHTAAESNAKRRALIDVLGVTPEGEPDENTQELMTPDQVIEITDLLNESGANRDKFFEHFGIDKVEDLWQTTYPEARKMLIAKKNARAK